MSEIQIRRKSRSVPVTVGTSVASSSTFNASDVSGGALTIHGTPSSNAMVLTFYGSTDGTKFRELVGGSVTLARVTDGTAFTGVSATYSFPAVGWRNRVRLQPGVVIPFLRLVSDADLGPDVDVFVSLKS